MKNEHKKIEDMHEKVADIQNTIWGIYKEFLNGHDMDKYNSGWVELLNKYRNKEDEAFFSFCRCQFISWEQIIRLFAEEFRNSD